MSRPRSESSPVLNWSSPDQNSDQNSDLGWTTSELGQTNCKLGRNSSDPNQNYCYTHIFSCMEIKNIIEPVTVIYQSYI